MRYSDSRDRKNRIYADSTGRSSLWLFGWVSARPNMEFPTLGSDTSIPPYRNISYANSPRYLPDRSASHVFTGDPRKFL